VAGDFDISVSMNGSVLHTDAGSATGTTYQLAAGTYVVSEGDHAGYNSSIRGACDGDGSVTLVAGQSYTCVVSNNDIAGLTTELPATPGTNQPTVETPSVQTPNVQAPAGSESFQFFSEVAGSKVSGEQLAPGAPSAGTGTAAGGGSDEFAFIAAGALLALTGGFAFFMSRRHR
jgi:hypothetical protein